MKENVIVISSKSDTRPPGFVLLRHQATGIEQEISDFRRRHPGYGPRLLVPDGVYVEEGEQLHFHRVAAPTEAELHALVYTIGERIGRCLERQGLLVRDPEHSALSLESGNDALEGLLGHSLTYRIALVSLRERELPRDGDERVHSRIDACEVCVRELGDGQLPGTKEPRCYLDRQLGQIGG